MCYLTDVLTTRPVSSQSRVLVNISLSEMIVASCRQIDEVVIISVVYFFQSISKHMTRTSTQPPHPSPLNDYTYHMI